MRLKEYLKKHKLTGGDFAKMTGLPASSVRAYAAGAYKPFPDRAAIIRDATAGLVTEFDRILQAPLRRVNRIMESRKRKKEKLENPSVQPQAPRVKYLSAPLSQALFLLGRRAEFLKHRGELRLDECRYLQGS